MARQFKFRGNQDEPGVYDVFWAGIITTAGGAAAEVVNIRGVRSTDVVFATQHTTTTRTLRLAAAGKNRVTLTFDNDPSTTHKVNIVVFRPRGGTSAARRVY